MTVKKQNQDLFNWRLRAKIKPEYEFYVWWNVLIIVFISYAAQHTALRSLGLSSQGDRDTEDDPVSPLKLSVLWRYREGEDIIRHVLC